MGNLFYEKVKICKIYLRFDFEVSFNHSVNTQLVAAENPKIIQNLFQIDRVHSKSTVETKAQKFGLSFINEIRKLSMFDS